MVSSAKLPSKAWALRFTKRGVGEELLTDTAIHRVVLANDAGPCDGRSGRGGERAVRLHHQLQVVRLAWERNEASVANAERKLPFARVYVEPAQRSAEDLGDCRQMADQAGCGLKLGSQSRSVFRA